MSNANQVVIDGGDGIGPEVAAKTARPRLARRPILSRQRQLRCVAVAFRPIPLEGEVGARSAVGVG